MAKDLTVGPRFDTRGLPEGYDPRRLYEYRHANVSENADGLEAFLYKLMPPSLVRSISFAIDPTARFKVSPHTITPVNRTRVRATDSVLLQRKRTYNISSGYSTQESHWMGITNCSSPYQVVVNNPDGVQVVQLANQPVLPSTIKDTTKRTRLLGSDQGELEIFRASINSPPRTIRWPSTTKNYYTGFAISDTCKRAGGTADYFGESWSYPRYTFAPTSAIYPLASYNALKASEIARNKALAQQQVVPLLLGINPLKRDYSLLRNAIELRDLPRSILSLKDTMEKLRRVYASLPSGKRDLIFSLKDLKGNIPNEYLSFHFGWKQTYKDLVDLLNLPEKLSKKLNFLLRRSGKPTTFRISRNFLSSESGVPGFIYDTVSNFEWVDWTYQSQSKIERSSEVRLVVNALFDFPPVNVPQLQSHRLRDFVGLNPRLIDVYNLTPWTWLFDWFTGIGQYVELIESINRDNNLINWGMISVVTKGELTTEFRSVVPNTAYTYLDGHQTSGSVVNIDQRHRSTLSFECHTRQDVGAVYDVKQTSIPSTLTAYQNSIIGALLAQRSSSKR